jgi:WD40 repeat protein
MTLKKLEEFKEPNYNKYNVKKSEGNPQAEYSRDHRESSPREEEDDVYEEIKRQRKFKLCGHSDAIFSLSISPDKRYIVSGSYDQTVRLWSIPTKTNLVVYKGHFSPVLSVKFSAYS